MPFSCDETIACYILESEGQIEGFHEGHVGGLKQ